MKTCRRLFPSPLIILLLVAAGLFLSGHLIMPSHSQAGEQKISEQSVDLLTKTGRAMAEISGAVKPAIVNIWITKTVKVSGGMDPFFDDPFFRRFFGEGFGHQRQQRERKSAGLGSGVLVSQDGYIITNHHVEKDADEIKVLLSDRREFAGKVIGTDPKTEIAVVKIEASAPGPGKSPQPPFRKGGRGGIPPERWPR